jgi:hypothetical protein
MSASTKITAVRIPRLLLEEMTAQIAVTNMRIMGPPYTVSSFIVAAIAEKLDHMERGRRSRCHAAIRGVNTECNPLPTEKGEQ